MAKIVIIAPSEADDDVKDAVKLLKAAGHDVDTDEPTPKSLLHIVLGLLGPNAYGFGPGYGYTPGGGTGSKEDDNATGDPGDPGPAEEDPEEAATEDDFHFESLGTVNVDGELIEAVTVDSDTSVLCVQNLIKGVKTTYSLNESKFSFWPDAADSVIQSVEVVVDKHRAAVALALHESVDGKAVLKVGKDLRDMFKKEQK